MKKKILILSLAVIMIAAASSTLTLSYFTDSASVVNGFTVGNVDVELFRYHSEVTSQTYDKQMASNLNTGYEEWLGLSSNILQAGKHISMKPYVLNTGNVDAYVRMRIYFPLELFDDEYFDYSYGGSSKLPDEEPGDSEFIRQFANVTMDGKRYKRITFTRREALHPGYKTNTPIYQYVGLSMKALRDENLDLTGFADKNGKLNVKITADAVQTYGFSSALQAFSYIDNN